jgi:ATP-dependent Clp protease adaptor protein ClpS
MSIKDNDHEIFTKPKTGVDLAERPKIDHPRQYNVILLNDDFTPMDFVVFVLKKIFHKTEHEAQQIMLQIHRKGTGIAGTFSREVAEMKLIDTLELAKLEQYPLQGKIEPCD